MNYWIYPGLEQKFKGLALNESMSSRADFNGLLDCCSFAFDVTSKAMLGSSRVEKLAFARHAFVKIARDHTKLSYASISRFLGKRNHATAISGYRQAENLLYADKRFKEKYETAYYMYTKANNVKHASKLLNLNLK